MGDTTQPMSPMRMACSHPSPSEPKLRAQAQKHPGRVTCHGSPRLCSPLPASRPPPHCLRKCPCRARPPCLTQGHCTCPSLVAQLQSCLLCPSLCLPEPIHPKYLLIASPALPPPLALTQQSFPTSHGPGGVSSRPFLTLTPLSECQWDFVPLCTCCKTQCQHHLPLEAFLDPSLPAGGAGTSFVFPPPS